MTSRERTYYGELDVREDATPSRIRAAFRKQARKYHPDRNPNNDAAETSFKRINTAYLVLGDATKREAYDRRLRAAREAADVERAERQAEQTRAADRARAAEQARAAEHARTAEQARAAEHARTAEQRARAAPAPAERGAEQTSTAQTEPAVGSPASTSRRDGKWARVGFWIPVILPISLGIASAWCALALGLGLITWTARRRTNGRRALVAALFGKPDRPWMTVVSFGLGLLFLLRCVPAIWAIHQTRAQAAQRAHERLMAEAQQIHDRAQAAARLPTRITIWRDELAHAQASADRQEVNRMLVNLEAEVEAETKELGVPVPSPLVAITDDLRVEENAHAKRSDVWFSFDLADTEIAAGRSLAITGDWLLADDEYRQAAEHLQKVEAAPTSDRAYIPKGYDVSLKQGELAGLRELIADPVARARKKEALEQKKRERESQYKAMCGPSPNVSKEDGDAGGATLPPHLQKYLKNNLSKEDGDVDGVRALVQRRAHDPDSIEIVDCTVPVLSDDDCWVFRCNVRGKNAFGAKVLQTLGFQHTRSGFHEAFGNGANPNPALVIEGPGPPQ